MSPYKNKMETFFGCLFHSWGGDTPEECVWAANDLIEFFIEMYDIEVTDRYGEEYETIEGREWEELTTEIYDKLKFVQTMAQLPI